MNEYQNERRENERRINRMRLARALYECIGGAWCKPQSKPVHPDVKRLADQLHYMPEQLCTDIQDTYRFFNDFSDAAQILGRITARHNAEIDQNRKDLDFIQDECSAGEVLQIIIAEYALRHYPDLLTDEE